MSDPVGVLSGIPYASRFARLVAFAVDAGLCVGLLIPIYWPLIFMFTDLEERILLTTDPALQMAFTPYLPVIAGAAIVLFVIQIVLLIARGQTIGKLLLRVKIVKRDTMMNGGFLANVVLRELMNGITGLVPPVFVLWLVVDSLFILRSDRRCLHDFIAGTIVVRA